MRTNTTGDGNAAFQAHAEIIFHDDAPRIHADVWRGRDAFPVSVIIKAPVGADLVRVAGDEAARCPESKLPAAANAAVPVCS